MRNLFVRSQAGRQMWPPEEVEYFFFLSCLVPGCQSHEWSHPLRLLFGQRNLLWWHPECRSSKPWKKYKYTTSKLLEIEEKVKKLSFFHLVFVGFPWFWVCPPHDGDVHVDYFELVWSANRKSWQGMRVITMSNVDVHVHGLFFWTCFGRGGEY